MHSNPRPAIAESFGELPYLCTSASSTVNEDKTCLKRPLGGLHGIIHAKTYDHACCQYYSVTISYQYDTDTIFKFNESNFLNKAILSLRRRNQCVSAGIKQRIDRHVKVCINSSLCPFSEELATP